MKLGIYGDSYGNLNFDRREGLGVSWVDEITALSNFTYISNYSWPGASLMYCYEQYKNTHHLHDFNIFIIPNLQRSYYPRLDNIGLFNNWYTNYNSVLAAASSVGNLKENPRYANLKRIIGSVLTYHQDWKANEFDILLNKTFALSLIEKENNVIFLYTDPILYDNQTFTLIDLSQWEMEKVGWNEIFSSQDIHYGSVVDGKVLRDARLCHLAEANNKILAYKILQAIDKKEKVLHLNKDDYLVPNKPLDFYIRWENL